MSRKLPEIQGVILTDLNQFGDGVWVRRDDLLEFIVNNFLDGDGEEILDCGWAAFCRPLRNKGLIERDGEKASEFRYRITAKGRAELCSPEP